MDTEDTDDLVCDAVSLGKLFLIVSKGHMAFIIRVKLLDPEDTSTTVLFETSRNYLNEVTESHPGDVCCHVFYFYRQTHCLSYVRCDTRGERRVDQMRKVSGFVVGNVFCMF